MRLENAAKDICVCVWHKLDTPCCSIELPDSDGHSSLCRATTQTPGVCPFIIHAFSRGRCHLLRCGAHLKPEPRGDAFILAEYIIDIEPSWECLLSRFSHAMMRHFFHDRDVIVYLLAVIFLSIPRGEGGCLCVIFVLSSSFAKKVAIQ